MKKRFSPGCGLMLYKPHLAAKLHGLLSENIGRIDMNLTCCRHIPPLESGIEVLNICPGCDRRYRGNYDRSTTVSLWEVLVETPFLPLPDYGGREMSILDACPTRGETRIHESVRELARRMNISIIEPRRTRTQSTCCGDSCYGELPKDQVLELMKKRAAEMPVEEIVVYCVSCVKSVFNGGRRPRYMIDLLFGEETLPQTLDPDLWHRELDDYIAEHDWKRS